MKPDRRVAVTVSRRSLLLGFMGAATALVGCGGGEAAPRVETTRAAAFSTAALHEGVFDSRFLASQVGWAVAVPRGIERTAPLPVLLYLHGLGADHRGPFDYVGLHRALQTWAAKGGRPFAIATVDGGDGWWKPQSDGTDASRMVIEEYLPVLRHRGFDIDTLALGGASMGGYGALRLAGSDRVRVRSVSVIAPALGEQAGRSGSLTDVSQHPERLVGTPVLLVVGTQDEFLGDDMAYAKALRDAGVTVTAQTFPGGHDAFEMSAAAPDVMRFTGEHLAVMPAR
jgi:predicted esterase